MKHSRLARMGCALLAALTLAAGMPASAAATDMHEIRVPETGVVVPPTLVTRVDTRETLDSLSEAAPAAAILLVSDDGQVTAGDGTAIGGFAEAFDRLGDGIIPVFQVKTEAAAGKLAAWLKEERPEECFVLSDSGERIEQVRSAHNYVRGIWDMTSNTAESFDEAALLDIRRQVNKSGCKIVLAPSWLALKDSVETLQKWLLTVWVEADGGAVSRTEAARLITSGANGIVCSDRGRIGEILSELPEKTLVRRPFVIGHRGDVTQAPENTIEAARAGIKNGADVIELDIHLTSDNELVIIHDEDVKRTTNGSGSVEKMTLEKVKSLVANKSFSNPSQFPEARIPTLREFFEEFKGTGIQFFVELKSAQTGLVPQFVKMVREFDIESQVSVISFDARQLQKVRQLMPEMTTGLLTSGLINTREPLTSVHNLMGMIEQLDSTLNHNIGAMNSAYVKTAADRGITLWPWTYNQEKPFKEQYGWGVAGLTTDSPEYAADMITSLEVVIDGGNGVPMKAGDTAAYTLNGVMQAGAKKDVTGSASVSMLDGDGVVSLTDGVLKAEGEGMASFLLTYTVDAGDGLTYTLTTQPVTVTVEKGFPTLLVVSVCAGAAVVIALAVLAAVLLRGKKSGVKN